MFFCGETDKGDIDLGAAYAETYRGLGGSFSGRGEELKILFMLWDEASSQRIHCHDTEPGIGGGLGALPAVKEVKDIQAHKHALEFVFFEDLFYLCAGQVGGDEDVVDKPFFFALDQAVIEAALFHRHFVMFDMADAPDVIEVEFFEVKTAKRFFNGTPGFRLGFDRGRHAFRGDVEFVAVLCHLFEGDAEDGFAFVEAVFGCGVEVVYSF